MTYRVYFNNAKDPQKWSVDEGTPATEITVMGVHLDNVLCTTECAPDESQPRAWLVVRGRMAIEHGWATFLAEAPSPMPAPTTYPCQWCGARTPDPARCGFCGCWRHPADAPQC